VCVETRRRRVKWRRRWTGTTRGRWVVSFYMCRNIYKTAFMCKYRLSSEHVLV